MKAKICLLRLVSLRFRSISSDKSFSLIEGEGIAKSTHSWTVSMGITQPRSISFSLEGRVKVSDDEYADDIYLLKNKLFYGIGDSVLPSDLFFRLKQRRN
jgi:hypothetical protein